MKLVVCLHGRHGPSHLTLGTNLIYICVPLPMNKKTLNYNLHRQPPNTHLHSKFLTYQENHRVVLQHPFQARSLQGPAFNKCCEIYRKSSRKHWMHYPRVRSHWCTFGRVLNSPEKLDLLGWAQHLTNLSLDSSWIPKAVQLLNCPAYIRPCHSGPM